jgi:hypothetical protein
MRYTAGSIVLLLLSLLPGCTVSTWAYYAKRNSTHYVRYTPATVPEADRVYLKGYRHEAGEDFTISDGPDLRRVYVSHAGEVVYEVTRGDRERGFVDIPPIEVEADDHLPHELDPAPIAIDESFWRNIGEDYYPIAYHTYGNKDSAVFQPDPDAPRFQNRVYLTVNSEPKGARVYSDGELIGTTPTGDLYFSLGGAEYQQGCLSREMVLVRDGYLPKTCTFSYRVPDSTRLALGVRLYANKLVILERDPSAPSTVYAPSPVPAPWPSPPERSENAGRLRAHDAAKREYDQALKDWENAKADYDLAVRGKAALDEKSDSDFLRAAAALNVDEKKRKLDVAQERLDRAKAALQALEWK